jgi:hypothetical protein
MMGRPWSQFGCFIEEENLLHLPGIELRVLCSPASILATMLTRMGNIFIVYLTMLSVVEIIYRRNDEKFMGQAVERRGPCSSLERSDESKEKNRSG